MTVYRSLYLTPRDRRSYTLKPEKSVNVIYPSQNIKTTARVHPKNYNYFSRTFPGLFKGHIRFSRTTYQEYHFTDST